MFKPEQNPSSYVRAARAREYRKGESHQKPQEADSLCSLHNRSRGWKTMTTGGGGDSKEGRNNNHHESARHQSFYFKGNLLFIMIMSAGYERCRFPISSSSSFSGWTHVCTPGPEWQWKPSCSFTVNSLKLLHSGVKVLQEALRASEPDPQQQKA